MPDAYETLGAPATPIRPLTVADIQELLQGPEFARYENDNAILSYGIERRSIACGETAYETRDCVILKVQSHDVDRVHKTHGKAHGEMLVIVEIAHDEMVEVSYSAEAMVAENRRQRADINHAANTPSSERSSGSSTKPTGFLSRLAAFLLGPRDNLC